MEKKSIQIFFVCLIAILTPSVLSECAEGCIRCGTNASGATACEICDLFSSFYKDAEGNCVRREIENCLIPSADQNEYYCAQCKMGYILDPENAKCVEVPSNKVVQNCRQYTLVGTCKHCYQHYFLEGNECNRGSVVIENCRTYFGDDLCQECIDDHYFDVETNTCVSFTPLEKCKSHTFKVCKSCKEGFHKNPNSNMLYDIDTDLVQHYATGLWEDVNYSKTWISTCKANDDENCMEMEESAASGKLTNNCRVCKDGFFLEQGVCKANPQWAITNCEKYSAPHLCEKCTEDFYLDCNECKNRSTYTSCLDKDWNKDRCFRCEDTHYLDSNGSCQSRSNGGVAQCSKYARRMDVCETCNAGFMRTTDMLECYAEIPNCSSYPDVVNKSDLKFTCDSCESDHYLTLDKLNCFEQNVEFCSNYDGSSNVCTTCHSDYYLDEDNNKCLLRNIPHCATPTPNLNECTNCDNLYKRENATTCTPINNPDCLENDTNTEDCTKCAPQRYIVNDGTRDICLAVIESLEVDECTYSESTTASLGCSECDNSDYGPRSFSGKKIIDMPTGCVEMDGTDCDQCGEGFNSDSYDSSNHVCSANTSTTSLCVQVENTYIGTLDESRGLCKKCRNTDTHFLKNLTCWERTPAFIQNCSSFGANGEDCLVCKEGFSAKETDATDGPICAQNPTDFTAMTGCLVYNIWDPSRCVKCDSEHILQENGLCATKTSNQRKLQPVAYFDQAAGNFETPYWYSENFLSSYTLIKFSGVSYFNALTCFDGAQKIVFNRSYGYIRGQGGIFADNYNTYCDSVHAWAQKDDGSGGKTPYVTEQECELAYYRSSTLFCFKCKNNMNPKFVAAKYAGDGTDIESNEYATVESCTTSADSVILSRQYSALGYRRLDNGNNTEMWEWEVPYDTCPNADDNLVVILSNHNNIFDAFKVSASQAQAEERSFCYDFGSSPPVQNCWVFGVDYNSTPNFNYRANIDSCIACKPGYTATIGSDARKITACTPIENCNTSDPTKNTWLNACETCADDHVHAIRKTGSQYYVDISTCSPRTITNCVLEEFDTNECGLCEIGFVLESSNTVCSPAPSMDNCTTLSWNNQQLKAYDLSVGSLSKQKFSFMGYIQRLFEETAAKEKCAQCSNDHSLMSVPKDGATFQCVANSTLTGLTENCKIFSAVEANKCLECVSTHIVDETGTCVEKSTLDSTVYIENCGVLDAASDPKKCSSCKENFYLNSTTFECIQYEHCLTYTTNSGEVECTKCADGKMKDYRDPTLCIDIIVPNCVKFDETEKACSQCESDYTRFAIQASTKLFSFCAKDHFSDASLNGEITFKLTTSGSSSSSVFSNFEINEGALKYVTTSSTERRSPAFCLSDIEPGCATKYPNMTCDNCSEGYWLDAVTQVCIKNTIPNCKSQLNLYECTTCYNCNHCPGCTGDACNGCDTCTESYFKNSIGQCQKQNVDDCRIYKTDDPGCTQCVEAHYLKDDKCYPHTVENCKDYEDDEDACQVCNDFYYVSDGKCVAHTVSGCKKYDANADECDSCHERYFVQNGKCVLNMGKNCKTYNPSQQGCDDCFSVSNTSHEGNFVRDSDDDCVPMEKIEGCIQYDLDSGDCDECADNYFRENNKCTPYPTGPQYCRVFSSSTSCTRCIPDYFIDPSTSSCMNIYSPIEKCMDYSTQTECKECAQGWMLNSDNTGCIQITVSNCKQVLTYDSCEVCEPGFVLVESLITSSDGTNKIKECQAQINHCIDVVSVESTTDRTDVHGNVKIIKSYTYSCNACSEGFVLSDDKLSCETTVLISNCYEYVKTDKGVTCGQCNMGYWLGKDQLSCTEDHLLTQYGCKDAYLSKEIVCNYCEAGYMMNASGECVECGGTGCAICDATSSSKCALCAPGYYMDSSKACKKNPNFSFSLKKEEIAGGDPINTTNRMVSADEGNMEGDNNFGMKLSAFVLGLVTLLVGFM